MIMPKKSKNNDKIIIGKDYVENTLEDVAFDLEVKTNGLLLFPEQYLPRHSFEMVYVKGDSFMMGNSPTHPVTLSDYYIGKYVVTQGLWEIVMGTTKKQQCENAKNNVMVMEGYAGYIDWELGAWDKELGEEWKEEWLARMPIGFDYPIEYVNWMEAQEFCTKLSQMTGKRYVLPTEAQWEYAARGGVMSKGYKYSGSNMISEVAWFDGNSMNKFHPVGIKSPNELGIYDMSGNVEEWCSDWYGAFSDVARINPMGPVYGSERVVRGGSYHHDMRYCRVFTRNWKNPDFYCGFRVVLLP